MARKRLALVAFEEGEGTWLIAKGDEEGVAVNPLFEGEQVSLHIYGLTDIVICQAGLTPVSIKRGHRYRFVKVVPDGTTPSKTCVEVLTK